MPTFSYTYTRKWVFSLIKKLRKHYVKAVSSSSPEDIEYKDKVKMLAIFYGRVESDIKSLIKDDEVKELGVRFSKMRTIDDSIMEVENIEENTFNKWMANQQEIVNAKIPSVLQKLFDRINRDQSIEDEWNLNETTSRSILILDNPMIYGYLNEKYEVGLLTTRLYSKGKSVKEIDIFIKVKKKYFEEMILKHIINLLISNRKIHYIEFRDALSILL